MLKMVAIKGLILLAVVGTVLSIPLQSKSISCEAIHFGFIPDPARCDGFFMCVNGVQIELSCVPGFFYDVELENCVLDEAGVCHTTPEANDTQ